ncbi:hypothetical protein L211DRAFT_843937 [Terfezia boudieri ATCC MYA-4762]|uniref:Uncharacterized protein n=1 Tax=Terfezia boudieri ATCC MYA-4762 TaxID=1051890 RepID=A0A3N4L6H2_9PEZI|nr:hypothetical protein L211DRAFT_843937 [Terfezia boudieri ATCC MYA-4762]
MPLKGEPNSSTSTSSFTIHDRSSSLAMDEEGRAWVDSHDTPRAYAVYTCHQIPTNTILKLEINPLELYNQPAASIYIYYCTLVEALFKNIPQEMRIGLSSNDFILRLQNKSGLRKDYDVPYWGKSKASRIKSHVTLYLTASGNKSLIELFLQSIAKDREFRSDIYSVAKALFFHRCVQWEDIGQFNKARKCECGGAGCQIRMKNELEKIGTKLPDDESLVEPVISRDGKIWGWPEEQRWYDLELNYGGQGARKKEFERYKNELSILGVEVPPQLYCST